MDEPKVNLPVKFNRENITLPTNLRYLSFYGQNLLLEFKQPQFTA